MENNTQNNLSTLYAQMQHIAKNVETDLNVQITPGDGGASPSCFAIKVDEKYAILIFTKEIRNKLLPLLLTVFKDFSFNYYIQQSLDNEYIVASKTDFENLNNIDYDVTKRKPFILTQAEVIEFLQLACRPINEKIITAFNTIADEHIKDNKAISLFLRRVAKKIGKNSSYNYNNSNNTFIFTDNDEKVFNHLFFVKGTRVKQICRYCSLSSLYQILSNQTIRLNGLVGMNDKSEYKYAWETFFGGEDGNEMEKQMNHTYIMSCSSISSKDDLEMWRLYGDDGKGVCLIFDVNKYYPPFALAQTIYSYTRQDKKQEEDQKWLLLKQLTDELKDIGLPLQLKNQNKWLPFLKSGDYYYEEEIRLLYDESENNHISKRWVLTDGNSIFNPYVQFDLLPKTDGEGEGIVIPLTLKSIILGPKCPEKEINVKQLANMLERDPALSNLKIEVTGSKITNYR